MDKPLTTHVSNGVAANSPQSLPRTFFSEGGSVVFSDLLAESTFRPERFALETRVEKVAVVERTTVVQQQNCGNCAQEEHERALLARDARRQDEQYREDYKQDNLQDAQAIREEQARLDANTEARRDEQQSQQQRRIEDQIERQKETQKENLQRIAEASRQRDDRDEISHLRQPFRQSLSDADSGAEDRVRSISTDLADSNLANANLAREEAARARANRANGENKADFEANARRDNQALNHESSHLAQRQGGAKEEIGGENKAVPSTSADAEEGRAQAKERLGETLLDRAADRVADRVALRTATSAGTATAGTATAGTATSAGGSTPSGSASSGSASGGSTSGGSTSSGSVVANAVAASAGLLSQAGEPLNTLLHNAGLRSAEPTTGRQAIASLEEAKDGGKNGVKESNLPLVAGTQEKSSDKPSTQQAGQATIQASVLRSTPPQAEPATTTAAQLAAQLAKAQSNPQGNAEAGARIGARANAGVGVASEAAAGNASGNNAENTLARALAATATRASDTASSRESSSLPQGVEVRTNEEVRAHRPEGPRLSGQNAFDTLRFARSAAQTSNYASAATANSATTASPATTSTASATTNGVALTGLATPALPSSVPTATSGKTTSGNENGQTKDQAGLLNTSSNSFGTAAKNAANLAARLDERREGERRPSSAPISATQKKGGTQALLQALAARLTGGRGATPSSTQSDGAQKSTSGLSETRSGQIFGQALGSNSQGFNSESSLNNSFSQNQLGQASQTSGQGSARGVSSPSSAFTTASSFVREQVSVNIQRAVEGKLDSVTVKLRPELLGRIEIRLEGDAIGRLQIVVLAERSETLDLLQRDSRQLEQALQEAGIRTQDQGLQFGLKGQGNAETQGDGQQQDTTALDDKTTSDDNAVETLDEPSLTHGVERLQVREDGHLNVRV